MLSARMVCPIARRQMAAATVLLTLSATEVCQTAAAQTSALHRARAMATDASGSAHLSKRFLTEEDAIRMVRIAGRGAISEYAGTLTRDFAYFSPDQKQFAIVLKKGNLEANTNDYSLLLFKSAEAFDSPKPRVLASMSSSSNLEGITDVFWLADNDTIFFLGQNPGETTQLYSVSSSSGIVRKLTNHAANLIGFTSDRSGERVVCAAERPPFPVLTDKTRREGVTVAREDMSDLLVGERHERMLDLVLFDTRTGASQPLPIAAELHGTVWGDVQNFALSPDGRQLVVKLNLTEIPDSWREYRDLAITTFFGKKVPKGSLTFLYRYALIDTLTGQARVLLDAPAGYRGSEVAWSRDSRSLILTGVFLPLGDSRGTSELLAHPSVVEIDARSFRYAKVSTEDLAFAGWDQQKGVLQLETRPTLVSGLSPEPRYFQKRENAWGPVSGSNEKSLSLKVTAEQNPSTPPNIVVSDPEKGQRAVLLELNPQLKEIELGHVEEIKFTGGGHFEVHAGLYFPPDYVPGNKYPLVVQTHGFDPKSFWVDGSFTTAFAAQALASHGMLVLQIPDRHDWHGTPDEAPNMTETLERAVEYVDGLGILDRDRLGIVGFSRTALYVYYMLTHSKMHFKAAVVADGSDGSYSQYIQFLTAYPSTAADSEGLNGGIPFGPGMLYWLRDSPEFLLDRVNTPLLVQAASRGSLSSQWAEFVGLRRLGKPAELMYFPTGTHILEKPWDRLASQQGTVDWCVFWMKGEGDSVPAKAEKYARWREMRATFANSQPRLK
jgi:dipeptidyl aminopeptidase/acylaminoacyl peptidase